MKGCSSYLFPLIMGYAKANEVLLMGRELSGMEAERANLVSEVIPEEKFEAEVLRRAKEMASFPPQALRDTKELIRGPLRPTLKAANHREVQCIAKRVRSDECHQAIARWMAERASKKKNSKL
eukprot:TRINITY_DN4217_c0_g2_i1.p2 TRINITY_DN4217_c0_g2~~TRINITY_DN4217_c0_g2_i1.p2  ORF type:complete len:123 (-),score=20.66 TRINITY_DN4217_c0_g2_i1:470-838(-)